MAEGSRRSPRSNGKHSSHHHHHHHHHHHDYPHNEDQQSTSQAQQQKKVCFICGTHTTFIINIYEPRIGPNIIDIINEKFKMRPLDDDKYLCYNCNNWLINWHSLQNKNDLHRAHDEQYQDDDDNDEDEEAVAAAAAASGSRRKRSGKLAGTSKRTFAIKNSATASNQSINDTNAMEDDNCDSSNKFNSINGESNDNINVNYCDDESSDNDSNYCGNDNYTNVDCVLTAAIHAVRTKLQKYLYYPRRRKISLSYGNNRHRLSLKNYYDFHQNDDKRYNNCGRLRGVGMASRRLNKKKMLIKCKLCCRPILIQLIRYQKSQNLTQRINRLSVNRKSSRSIELNAYKFCRKCRFVLSSYNQRKQSNHVSYGNGASLLDSKDRYQPKSLNEPTNSNILAHTEIVDKLKLLGTSIFYESEECRKRQQLHQQQPFQTHHFADSEWNDYSRLLFNKTNEIDTCHTHSISPLSNTSKPTNLSDSRTTNEIVLTFDTVVTEVFPIELFNADAGYNIKNAFHREKEQTDFNALNSFLDMTKKVPKSLSITLA